MAEEVNYASVVFKSHKKTPEGSSEAAPPQKKEETIYDEVKVQSNETEQPADANIALSRDQRELSQLRENQRKTRRQLDEVMGNNTDLKIQNTDLTVQLDELAGNNTDLKIQNTNLTIRNQDLETRQRNWNKLNVSRAQWSVDNYCPKKDNERSCKACQDGWENTEPFCYAINDASFAKRKTWEEAREDCRGKSSDLAVVNNIEEKKTIREYSWGPRGSQYWLGLKVEDGQWKWINGTDLSRSYWIVDPLPGHCAVSVHNTEKWLSVRCDRRNRWICRKDALSV